MFGAGDLAGGLQSYRAGLAIKSDLAQSNPGKAVWQRGLSVSYNKVGDSQRAQGHRVRFGAYEDAARWRPCAHPCPRKGLPRRETTTAIPLSHVDQLEELRKHHEHQMATEASAFGAWPSTSQNGRRSTQWARAVRHPPPRRPGNDACSNTISPHPVRCVQGATRCLPCARPRPRKGLTRRETTRRYKCRTSIDLQHSQVSRAPKGHRVIRASLPR